MPESLYAKPDLTKKARFQRDVKEERNEGVYETTDDTVIYDNVNVMVAASEDQQKPTDDKFQEKRNPCRIAAVCLGLLTLLLLAGITGLGIHYFHEKTDWGVEIGLLWEGNANLSSARDQIQASYNIKHEEANKLKSEKYNLSQRISQSEEQTAHLQAVNSNITNQRDELQKMLDERDCCPQNWQKFHNHCYNLSTSSKTWNESKKDCENQRAYLVTITSKEEQDFISRLRVEAWIGLVREDGNLWKWVDGSPLTTLYWAVNQPDDAGNDENCAETFKKQYLWNDLPCRIKRRWICKKEI